LFKKYKKNENFKNNATFIIIDFNGEYIDNAIIAVVMVAKEKIPLKFISA
jgi:hypothetical protein